MDIVQIRRAKLNRDKFATTRLRSCFGLTRGRSLGVPFGRYAMNKFATYRHSALDAESHKLVENEFTLKILNQVQDDNLHSSPEGVNKGLEYQFQPLRLLKKGEARWGATRRAKSSWIPVLRTRMTIRALGGVA